MQTDKEKALKFLAIYFGGEHHIPLPLKTFGDGFSVTTTKKRLQYL